MAAKTIVLKGHGIRKEAVADGAITPGHLVYLKSTGKVGVHATAGGVAQKAFAVEDDLQGRAIDTAYADASPCQYNVMKKGEEVNALLANGESASIGSLLVSAGDGTLAVASSEVGENVVGIALSALDLSDSSGADPASSRIDVEIM